MELKTYTFNDIEINRFVINFLNDLLKENRRPMIQDIKKFKIGYKTKKYSQTLTKHKPDLIKLGLESYKSIFELINFLVNLLNYKLKRIQKYKRIRRMVVPYYCYEIS